MIPDGIYENISAPTYFQGDEWAGRASPSVAEWGMLTPEHMHAAYHGEITFDSPALEFGRAYHTRMLEPERFKKDFAVAQQCEAATGKGARCSKTGTRRFGGHWYCPTPSHGPEFASEVEVLTAKEAETVNAMGKRLYAHNVVKLLRAQGGSEVSIAWTCPRTGLKLKSRLDKWSPSTPEILDLKTIRSADPHALCNAIEEYGWARAAEMRKDGIEVLTGTRPFYTLIAQEKTAPYAVAAINFDEETQRGSRWEMRGILATWARCVKEGKYPGYSDDFIELGAPEYKLKMYRNLVPEDVL